MSHKSKYAAKVKANKQTYGTGHSSDGCCAHKRPQKNMEPTVKSLLKTQIHGKATNNMVFAGKNRLMH